MEFNKELIMQKNVVIHCDTKEKAELLLSWTVKEKLKWITGNSYLKRDNWHWYKDQTGYCIGKGIFGTIDTFEKEGYKILKLEEVLQMTEIKAGVDKKYNVGEYSAQWAFGNDYKEEGDYSSIIIKKEEYVLLDLCIGINHLSINQANQILSQSGFKLFEEKKITIITKDGQELEISEDKAIELGFKIK